MSTSDHDFYPYDPSLAAAIIFIACFGLILIVKAVDYVRFRRNKSSSFPYVSDTPDDEGMLKVARKQVSVSLIPICIGIFFEVLGYAMRIISIQKDNRTDLTLYIIPSTFTLISPSLMSAGIFMMFNRIEKFLNAEKHSIMPNKFLTVFFVTGDIVSFLVQGLGGGLMVGDNSRQLGLKLSLLGFALQIFFFAFFIVVATVWLWRMTQKPTELGQLMDLNELDVRYYQWRRLAKAMIASMVLILIRCILRIAEFSENISDETNMSNSEVAFYLIDPFLIFWSSVVLVAIRPEYRLWEMRAYQVWLESAKVESTYTNSDKDLDQVVIASDRSVV